MLASFTWNVRAGLSASYTAAADWIGAGDPPGPGDLVSIAGGGIATTVTQIDLGMSVHQAGTLLLSGSGTQLSAGGVAVGVFGSAAFSITNGATLITAGVGAADSIGYEAGGTGSVTIDGTGSVWTSQTSFLNVGYEGSAALTIRNGGALRVGGYLAVDGVSLSSAMVVLTGAGSLIAATAGIDIEGGGGQLTVGAGATLTSGGMLDRVGDLAGAGLASVSGAAALWSEGAQTLIVADPSGNSLLSVAAGGSVIVAQSLQIGDTSMAGSVAISAGGVLRLTAASQNVAFLVTLGSATGSAGTITVSGAGAVLDTGGNPLLLGGLGTGTLTVGAGGTVDVGVSNDTQTDDADALSVGEYAGSVGSLSVSGAGADMVIAGGGFAGSGGMAHIVVATGGVLTVGDLAGTPVGIGLSIGAGAPTPGTTRITSGGTADLTVTTLGTLVERNGFSVGLHGSAGSVTIGAGGVLDYAGQMVISNGDTIVAGGSGSVTVAAGGTLTCLGATLADPLATAGLPALSIGQGGYATGVAGTLTVTGAGAVVNTGSFGIAVGDVSAADPTNGGGTGFLTIGGGASVISGTPQAGGSALSIGVAANSAGTVSLSDVGSSLVATGAVDVGVAGAGSLAVMSGARLQASTLSIGVASGGSGVLSVNAGAALAISGGINVGIAGSGTLNVASGAIVSLGAVTIGAEGSVTLDESVPAGQTIDFAAASGTLQIGNAGAFDGVVAGFVAGDTLDLSGVSQATVTVAISGIDAALSFSSGGALTLAGGYGVNGTNAAALVGLLETQVQRGAISGITLAATGTTMLALSLSQAVADQDALRMIQAPYILNMSGIGEEWAGPTLEQLQLGGSGLQEVQFADGQLSITADPASASAQVYRMYLSALGRVPDPAGLAGWTGALQGGMSLVSLAQAFIASNEFATRYGTDVSPTAFVTLLYQNVLGRVPDPGGLAAWTGAYQGGLSEAQILVDFSESPEHIADTPAASQMSSWALDPNAAEVGRLYNTLFATPPTAAQLTQWVTPLDNGTLSLQQVAADLLASPTFQASQGASSNTAFVTLLYANALQSAPDPTGLATWVATLASGVSRAVVALDFSDSAQSEANTAAAMNNPAQPAALLAGPVQASASVISAGIDTLQASVASGAVPAISLTDTTTAVVSLTSTQLVGDLQAVRFITGSYYLNLGTATVENTGAAVQSENLGNTSNAESVQFADGRIVYGVADPAAQVYRMYLSALGRVPDQAGEYDWTGAVQSGTPLLTLAQDFIGSGEFIARYGSNPSNTDFVTLLYNNVLGRAPDAPGLAAWTGSLAGGTSQAQMLLNFSESPEHITDTSAAIRAGVWDV